MKISFIELVNIKRIFMVNILLPDFTFNRKCAFIQGNNSETFINLDTRFNITYADNCCEERVKMIGCILGFGIEIYFSYNKWL